MIIRILSQKNPDFANEKSKKLYNICIHTDYKNTGMKKKHINIHNGFGNKSGFAQNTFRIEIDM